MRFQIAVADADDDKLETLALAIFEDRADYLLADALPGQADLLPDQSGDFDTPEAIHGFVQDVRALLVSQRAGDGALLVELADSEAYGEGSEFEPVQMLKVLR
jgi:hypothetical protein